MGGDKWGHATRGASTHLIQPFESEVLSRNLDQNMPKNAYFFEKKLKNRSSVGASPSVPHQPPEADGSGTRPLH